MSKESGTIASTVQSEKFKALARELECDESEEAFDDALKRVATAPPPAEKVDGEKK
ncbi:DNA-binding protein [Maricaulis sp.]|uniref:DNA-binding protein n=1 Tax=Maricaulis sp. TaxID=1486257 RepID=UPI003A92DBC3